MGDWEGGCMALPSLLLKRLSGIFASVFFLNNCLLAHVPEANFWAERRKYLEKKKGAPSDPLLMAALPAPSPARLLDQLSIPPSRLALSLSEEAGRGLPPGFAEKYADLLRALPPAYGSLRKINLAGGLENTRTRRVTSRRSSPPIVIHIQDVHQNPEAQKNIGKVIQELIAKKQVGLVALEAAFEPIDVQAYRAFPDREVIRKTADYLLRENKITGPVHTAMTVAHEIPPFVGVDDARRYQANVEAYKESVARAEDYKERLKETTERLQNRKLTVFNSNLLAFDNQVQAHHRDGKTTLGEYLKGLISSSPRALQSSSHQSSSPLDLQTFYSVNFLLEQCFF